MSIFTNKKIYLCGSIGGVKDVNTHDLIPLTCEYLLENDANVLDEHMRGKSTAEMIEIVYQKTGVRRDQSPTPWNITVDQDMKWIDEAEYVIAFVDGPSHGVGIEVGRASLKPRLGLNITPILLLVHEDNLQKLSLVMRGMPRQGNKIYLNTYRDLSDIKSHITTFISNN